MDNEGNEATTGPVLYKFTNDPSNTQLDDLLAMFYRGIYDNSVGIMTALNSETDKEEVVLVGVTFDEEGKTTCYPIAVALASEDVSKYKAPDGKGGYYDPSNPSEVAAAKEDMRSFNEAVQPAVGTLVN